MNPADCRKPRLGVAFSAALAIIGLTGSGSLAAGPVIFTLPQGVHFGEIQQALDDLPPDGQVVLGEGVFEISHPIMLRHDNQTLRGSGAATVLRLADNANCPVVILGAPMVETNRPSSHLRLADLVIDGNRTNQSAELWQTAADGGAINNNGVQVWNVNDAVIEHVTCHRCRSGGMVTVQVRRLLVSDFDAYDNQFDGLACYQTEESRFTNLRLHDNLAAGISLDLAFNHNTIADAQLNGNDLGVFMRDSCNNSFRGVTILKSHNDGIFIAQTATQTDKGWLLSPGTECTGNTFEKINVNACGGTAFQINDASCTNNTLSGAVFVANARGVGQPHENLIAVHDLVQQ